MSLNASLYENVELLTTKRLMENVNWLDVD